MPVNITNEKLGEGLSLSMDTVPSPARFRIGLLRSGRLRWKSGERVVDLEASTAWWFGPQHEEEWSLPTGAAEGLWLTGDEPFSGLEPELTARLEMQGPRTVSHLVSDLQELFELQTNCRFACELKTLLVRGKALMIVSKVLHALGNEPQTTAYDVKFFKNELDRVREARSLLVDRMADPPNLGELARMVGLNELKLKAGFHRLWGTTVFGLLRRERMTAARVLLDREECNVSEAAFRVGYTNISHFARAFRAEFGVTPGSLARRRSE
jgi:AraC-like DNA-binding protein